MAKYIIDGQTYETEGAPAEFHGIGGPIGAPTVPKQRATSKRVKLNLAALDQLQFAVAVGVGTLMEGILDEARPHIPDDPSTPTSIAKTEGWLVMNGTRKVAGSGSKPRSFSTRRPGMISGVVGYGSSLAHLHERGTIGRVQESTGRFTGALPARPYLLPATAKMVKEMGATIGRAIADAGFSKPGGTT